MFNNKQSHTPMVIAVLLLVGVLVYSFYNSGGTERISGSDLTQEPKSTDEQAVNISEHDTITLDGEMMAVWVPFMTLSLTESNDKSETAFKAKFDNIIEVAKECKMNALIVHVRPFGDALYPSELFPWSHILTGSQGTDPGYDPLEYMVSAAHEAGLQFHAWINPLRIKDDLRPDKICDTNPGVSWADEDDRIVSWNDQLYYNPSNDYVRQHIISGVEEIVKNYAVDGIHFDDYFYPTTDSEFDKKSYESYCNSVSENSTALTLLEWRTSNISALISGVYSKIKSINPKVQFGISPQANVKNDTSAGADVKSWCSVSGYVDYICPQIYMNFEHTLLPFDESATQWRKIVTNKDIKLYIGLAVYKAGSDADEGTWENSQDIIKKQIEYGRDVGADGFMFYSWNYLKNDQTTQEIENAMKVI